MHDLLHIANHGPLAVSSNYWDTEHAARGPMTAPRASGATQTNMTTRKHKSARHAFARGNKAASKGEPRNITLSIRIPASTDAEIRRRAEQSGGSRSDVVIAALR